MPESGPAAVQDVRPRAVRPVPLGRVLDLPGVTLVDPDYAVAAATEVSGVTIDSRQVRPGDLFAAVPGAHVHRADFVPAAVAAGAVAVLTDPDGAARARTPGVPVLVAPDPRAVLGEVAATVYGRPADRLRTVAVTGTNGKTTVATLVAAALEAAGERTGLVGTVETRIGDTVLPSVRTTPEASELQALLAAMVEADATAVAMEASSHALTLGRMGGLVADVGVFLNLGHDHLDFHADLDEYFAAKARLLTPEHARSAVVNLDDPYGERLAVEPALPTVTFSAEGDARADWRAESVDSTPGGSRFVAVGPHGSVPVGVQIPGRFNVANALAALVAAVAVGADPGLAASGIGSCAGVAGRMERVVREQRFLALVDYAHTPEAVESLLGAVRPLVSGRTIVVLGCGGDRDREKRPAMGEVAARGADLVIITDDNPRSEDPAAIRAAVRAGAERVPADARAEVLEVGDRALAIAEAVRLAADADAVVVAGKGHESGQEIGATTVPFDDASVLGAAIGAAIQDGLASC